MLLHIRVQRSKHKLIVLVRLIEKRNLSFEHFRLFNSKINSTPLRVLLRRKLYDGTYHKLSKFF